MPKTRQATTWFNDPTAVATYQFIAAPSVYKALVNRRLEGRNTCVSSVYPGWSPLAGMSFNGSSSFLTTGVVPGDFWTFLIRITSWTTIFSCPFGIGGTFVQSWSPVTTFRYSYNNAVFSGASLSLPAVLCVAGTNGYLNAVQDITTMYGTQNGTPASGLMVGARNDAGTPANYAACVVPALAMYNRLLTQSEIALYSQQMRYCEHNPAWNAWSQERRHFAMTPAAGGAAKMNTYYRRMRS